LAGQRLQAVAVAPKNGRTEPTSIEHLIETLNFTGEIFGESGLPRAA
jgi:hypothetical protein